MNANQSANELKGWIDWLVTWAYWASAVIVTLMFAATVFRSLGLRLPYIPSVDGQPLLYLAGAAWLLKR